MKIAVDFDGTCVKHEFPRVGPDVPHAVETLRALSQAGHELFLYTMRSGEFLMEAVQWFGKHNIPLSGIQTDPEQSAWTTSPKCYADVYIDDAAYGCPLITPQEGGGRPYVDWGRVLTHIECYTPHNLLTLDEVREMCADKGL